MISSNIPVKHTDLERYRAGQLQAERMLEAREQSHRQQIHRLENQVILLLVNCKIENRNTLVYFSFDLGCDIKGPIDRRI